MGDDEVQVRAAAERLVAAFGSGRLTTTSPALPTTRPLSSTPRRIA
jgi:hypothetical protein